MKLGLCWFLWIAALLSLRLWWCVAAVLGLLKYVRKQLIEGGKANAFAGMGILYGGGPAGWSMSIATALPEP